MARTIKCVKLGRDAVGMPYKPFDDELGQKIFDGVSFEAWKMWPEHSKMLINEYLLDLVTPEAQSFLREQMDSYFFGPGAQMPPGYVPEQAKAK